MVLIPLALFLSSVFWQFYTKSCAFIAQYPGPVTDQGAARYSDALEYLPDCYRFLFISITPPAVTQTWDI